MRLRAFITEVRARPEDDERPFSESDAMLASWAEEALTRQEAAELKLAEVERQTLEISRRAGPVTESRKVYLGTLQTEPDESLAIDLPADLDPNTIRNAIERANIERAEKQAQESRRLHEMFGVDAKDAPT